MKSEIIFLGSAQHTGTTFTQSLLSTAVDYCEMVQIFRDAETGDLLIFGGRYADDKTVKNIEEAIPAVNEILEQRFKAQIRSAKRAKTVIYIVQSHFGEPEPAFIRDHQHRWLINQLPTVVPVRDPLMTLISKNIRDWPEGYELSYPYIVEGYRLITELANENHKNLFFFPIDLYVDNFERQRLVYKLVLGHLSIQISNPIILNKYITEWAKLGGWRTKLGKRGANRDHFSYAKRLFQLYDCKDIKGIAEMIPNSYRCLMDIESTIRPFMERLGYKDLIW